MNAVNQLTSSVKFKIKYKSSSKHPVLLMECNAVNCQLGQMLKVLIFNYIFFKLMTKYYFKLKYVTRSVSSIQYYNNFSMDI